VRDLIALFIKKRRGDMGWNNLNRLYPGSEKKKEELLQSLELERPSPPCGERGGPRRGAGP